MGCETVTVTWLEAHIGLTSNTLHFAVIFFAQKCWT